MDNSHTEDEAKTLWCPHFDEKMRAILYPLHSDEVGACIASRCSQWQWAHPSMEEKLINALNNEPEICITGYCGLARGK